MNVLREDCEKYKFKLKNNMFFILYLHFLIIVKEKHVVHKKLTLLWLHPTGISLRFIVVISTVALRARSFNQYIYKWQNVVQYERAAPYDFILIFFGRFSTDYYFCSFLFSCDYFVPSISCRPSVLACSLGTQRIPYFYFNK